MKEYEATGKFVNISKYEKKMDSECGFWQKLEMSMWRLLILVYIKNIEACKPAQTVFCRLYYGRRHHHHQHGPVVVSVKARSW